MQYNVKNRAKIIHELFVKVRACYLDLLQVISDASKFDAHVASELFMTPISDALLLKQEVIGESVLKEVVDKNNLLFTIYMPSDSSIHEVYQDEVSNFDFYDAEMGKLASRYNEIQLKIILFAKEIVNESPIVAQQLFDLDNSCRDALDNISMEKLIKLSERYAWLVVLNNKRTGSVFYDTAGLRNKSDRTIIDSAMNY